MLFGVPSTKTNTDPKFQFDKDRGPVGKLAKVDVASSLKHGNF